MKCMSLNANSTCSRLRQTLLGELTSPVSGLVANLMIVILFPFPKLRTNKLHQQKYDFRFDIRCGSNCVSLSSFVDR
jgi:hypothetical protein